MSVSPSVGLGTVFISSIEAAVCSIRSMPRQDGHHREFTIPYCSFSLTILSKVIQFQLWQPWYPAPPLFYIMTSRGPPEEFALAIMLQFYGLFTRGALTAIFGISSSIILPCLRLVVPQYFFPRF